MTKRGVSDDTLNTFSFAKQWFVAEKKKHSNERTVAVSNVFCPACWWVVGLLDRKQSRSKVDVVVHVLLGTCTFIRVKHSTWYLSGGKKQAFENRLASAIYYSVDGLASR